MGDTQHDSAAFSTALEVGDLAALRAVPKGDLHVHGLCGGTRASYAAWCGRKLPDPPAVFPDFASFDHYLLETLGEPYASKQGEDLRGFIRFFFRDTLVAAINDGVTVIEPSMDASLIQFFDNDATRMVEEYRIIIESVRTAHPGKAFEVRPELGMARDYPLELLDSWVPAALGTGFFRSIDLYGTETAGDDAAYVRFYRMAAERGLRRKAHSGEYRPAAAVRRSVELFDLDAVQHGLSAAADPDVLDFLAARGTVLNLCPTSNMRLGRVPSIAAHPIGAIARAGVKVTVNSDDRIVFDKSASEEYLALYQAGVLSAAELDRIRGRSLGEG